MYVFQGVEGKRSEILAKTLRGEGLQIDSNIKLPVAVVIILYQSIYIYIYTVRDENACTGTVEL